MSIPDYQSIMLPLLKFCGDNKEHSIQEARDFLSSYFKLSDSERKEVLASGQRIFENRVGWARTYLKKAGLMDYSRKAHFKITDRGLNIMKEKPPRIDVKFLRQFDEFVEFQSAKKDLNIESVNDTINETPEETIELGYNKLRKDLSFDLLNRVKCCSPQFFEQLVVDLLVKMGYGGSRADAGKAVGKSGDGGIDGIIKEDKLGLDVVYIQAKRWDNSTVGRPEIHKFVGALQGQRAKKGVFITSSSFSSDAREYVSKIDCKVVLIDGNDLTFLMIENNIGVTPISKYEIKKIDSDYFADE
jgi:restriction system protein